MVCNYTYSSTFALTTICVGFIHVTNSFIFSEEQNSIVQTQHNVFTHSPVDRHLGMLPIFLLKINIASKGILVCILSMVNSQYSPGFTSWRYLTWAITPSLTWTFNLTLETPHSSCFFFSLTSLLLLSLLCWLLFPTSKH